MEIIIGCDHAAYDLKTDIKAFLAEYFPNMKITDKGSNLDPQTKNPVPCDYPDIAKSVCETLAKKHGEGEEAFGILLCGTGIGMSMAANRFKGIRAAVCSDEFSAKYTRLHNDANVLCLGSRVVGIGLARELVNVFLTTSFEGGRHAQRILKLEL